MVSLRFTSLIFIALFLLHALRNSLANAHQAEVADRFEAAIMKENHGFGHKELIDANNNHVAKRKNTAIGGRKMMMKGREVEEDDDHKMMMKNRRSPALSGDEGRKALKNSPKRSFDDSYNQEKVFHYPRSSNNPPSSTKSDKPSNRDEESKARKDESKRLFEATKEIMKLMHKDYGGRWRPRRKPPIHNRIPQN